MFRAAILFYKKRLWPSCISYHIYAVRTYSKWRCFCHHERSERIFVTVQYRRRGKIMKYESRMNPNCVKSWQIDINRSDTSRDSTVTRLRDKRSGFQSRQEQQVYLLSQTSRPTPWPTQPPTDYVPRIKAAEEWGWPLISNCCRGKEWMELHHHSPYMFSWLVQG